MTTTFTFAVDGLEPRFPAEGTGQPVLFGDQPNPASLGEVTADDAWSLLHEGDLFPVVEHHQHGHHSSVSWYLLHDDAATWGTPGSPQLRSVVVQRDLAGGTFTFAMDEHALAALGQGWLMRHGCPPEHAAQRVEGLPPPADARTRAVEERLRTATGLRITDHWSEDDHGWMLAVDTVAVFRRYRVFLESAAPTADAYTVSEGAFTSITAAHEWLDGDRGTPLPRPPAHDLLARTAKARSTGPSAPEADPRPPSRPSGPGESPGRSR
jgi:hypothetical protein